MDFELAYYLVCTRGREIETRKIGKTLTWFPHLKDLVSVRKEKGTIKENKLQFLGHQKKGVEKTR